jgi:hypothetical protein
MRRRAVGDGRILLRNFIEYSWPVQLTVHVSPVNSGRYPRPTSNCLTECSFDFPLLSFDIFLNLLYSNNIVFKSRLGVSSGPGGGGREVNQLVSCYYHISSFSYYFVNTIFNNVTLSRAREAIVLFPRPSQPSIDLLSR